MCVYEGVLLNLGAAQTRHDPKSWSFRALRGVGFRV